MVSEEIYSKITGLGIYTPKRKISNEELSNIAKIDTSDDWIQGRTGIKFRNIASENESLTYMATEASKKAIEMANKSEERLIDLIILASNTTISDPLSKAGFPNTSGAIQKELMPFIRKNCGIFDLQSGCSGINYALFAADGIVKGNNRKRILVIGSDILSYITDFNNRSTCVLFSDGASSYILDSSREPGFVGHYDYGNGQLRDIITSPIKNKRHIDSPPETYNAAPTLIMNGRKVHEVIIKLLEDTLINFRDNHYLNPKSISLSEIKKIILHQANCRTIEKAAANIEHKLKLRENEIKDKFIVTISDYANSSTASQGPGLMEVVYGENKLKNDDHILMIGYGAGFSACFNHYII